MVTKVAEVVIDGSGYTVDGVRGVSIDSEAIRLQIDGKRRSNDAFAVLLAAPKLARVELVVDGKSVAVRFDKTAPDGPGMKVELTRTGDAFVSSTSGTEGTRDKPLLVTRLDEPGINALRASVAEVQTRTKAKRIDAIVDRVQLMTAVVDLVDALRGYDVRLVAGVPTGATALVTSIAAPPGLGKLLDKNEAPLRSCFEEALRREGPMAGISLEVSNIIDKTGAITEARVATTKDATHALINCVSTAVAAWKLTAPPGAYQFTVNFKAP